VLVGSLEKLQECFSLVLVAPDAAPCVSGEVSDSSACELSTLDAGIGRGQDTIHASGGA